MIAAGAAAAIAATVVVARPFEPPQDLGRLSEASEEAGAQSERIIANLEQIARNLEEGSGLAGNTEEIRALTEQQRESLGRLAELLERQLDAIDESTTALEGTRASTEDLAQLSDRQVELLEAAVSALERLRTFARDASKTSAMIEAAAAYGARLARDSARAFSP